MIVTINLLLKTVCITKNLLALKGHGEAILEMTPPLGGRGKMRSSLIHEICPEKLTGFSAPLPNSQSLLHLTPPTAPQI